MSSARRESGGPGRSRLLSNNHWGRTCGWLRGLKLGSSCMRRAMSVLVAITPTKLRGVGGVGLGVGVGGVGGGGCRLMGGEGWRKGPQAPVPQR